jgi:hypothetical protein
MTVTNWRVGDVSRFRLPGAAAPRMTTSQGTTRISLARPGMLSIPSGPAKAKTPVNHSSAFGVVYVNEIARASMFSSRPVSFPVGSIIVREKLSSASALKPDLLALMVKREKGFNPRLGDWEFLVANGDGTKIEMRERKGECRNCHATQIKNDYVFSEGNRE